MQNNKKYFLTKPARSALEILSFLFFVSVIFAFDTPSVGILTLLAALMHELGHICAILYVGGSFSLYSLANGFRIKPHGTFSYKKELAVLLFGPAANLAAFLVSLPFFGVLSGYMRLFGLLNLLTAISNLLPIEGYDGFRILSLLLEHRSPSGMGLRMLSRICSVTCAALCFLSLYLMAKLGGGFWIYFIFIGALVKRLGREHR